MDILKYNSAAWDGYVERSIEWSIPVSSEEIERARKGDWEVVLTPIKVVPHDWFGDIGGKDILCLASGGGQQAPIFVAAGANVISFDNSAKQLEKDRLVAEREGLNLRLEKGDAADLSRFADKSFDLIFHPCSNCFMEEILPVWRECFRVLRHGGSLLSGFNNPFVYIFDRFAEERGILELRHKLPYSDSKDLTEAEKNELIKNKDAFEFSHTLDTQIGGQIGAGFLIAGFYEDWWNDESRPLNKFAPSFIATKAVRP
ncbi:MAG: class I SAM-dependent methyltransferase [Pyrinomonadaceae bacterium]|nr:class I SAM-dependent methyltransferase [Pyrinomonadaceae bacterium]